MSLGILKEKIENMSKHHQIEVLRLLSTTDCVCTNENNNGTFINLTEQTTEVIKALEEYSKYVDEQQSHLNSVEVEKEEIKKTFFDKDVKDITSSKIVNESTA